MPKILFLNLSITKTDVDNFFYKEQYNEIYHDIYENNNLQSITSDNDNNIYTLNNKNIDIKVQPELKSYNNITDNIIDNIYINKDFTTLSLIENLDNIKKLGNFSYEYSICWNCCHSLDKDCFPVPIPTNYDEIKKIFTCHGIFCSFNCALRYIITSKIKDTSYLLYYMYKKCTLLNDHFKAAPPRETLIMFGGILTIEAYRNNFKKLDIFNTFSYPLIYTPSFIHETIKKPENNQNNKKQQQQQQNNKINLNLNISKKKSTKSKSNILSMLNIKI